MLDIISCYSKLWIFSFQINSQNKFYNINTKHSFPCSPAIAMLRFSHILHFFKVCLSSQLWSGQHISVCSLWAHTLFWAPVKSRESAHGDADPVTILKNGQQMWKITPWSLPSRICPFRVELVIETRVAWKSFICK